MLNNLKFYFNFDFSICLNNSQRKKIRLMNYLKKIWKLYFYVNFNFFNKLMENKFSICQHLISKILYFIDYVSQAFIKIH